jgi:hypothetical protein
MGLRCDKRSCCAMGLHCTYSKQCIHARTNVQGQGYLTMHHEQAMKSGWLRGKSTLQMGSHARGRLQAHGSTSHASLPEWYLSGHLFDVCVGELGLWQSQELSPLVSCRKSLFTLTLLTSSVTSPSVFLSPSPKSQTVAVILVTLQRI